MDLEILVRHSTHADLTFLVHGNTQLAWETEQRKLDQDRLRRGVKALLDDPARGFYLIATVDSEPVGQLLITFEWSDWRNGVFWWLQSVYVLPAWRQHGVFRALYKHVETLARQHGEVCGLRLYVEAHNDRARATYLACGMRDAPYHMLEIDHVFV